MKNPFVSKSEGFCVKALSVNDSAIQFVNASTFEIDLRKLGLNDGDSLNLKITHKCGCTPKILNPVHHYPQRLGFLWSSVFGDTLFMFTVNEKSENARYYLQQYRWNKWNSFDSIHACRSGDTCTFTFSLGRHLHPGVNKFRVYKSGAIASHTFQVVTPSTEEIQPENKITGDQIGLPHNTWYELWDEYGKRVRLGYGNTIDASGLYKGTFYLNYDNRSVKIEKE